MTNGQAKRAGARTVRVGVAVGVADYVHGIIWFYLAPIVPDPIEPQVDGLLLWALAGIMAGGSKLIRDRSKIRWVRWLPF